MHDPDGYRRKCYLEHKRRMDKSLTRLRELRKGRPRSKNKLIPLGRGAYYVLGFPSEDQILRAVASIPIVE